MRARELIKKEQERIEILSILIHSVGAGSPTIYNDEQKYIKPRPRPTNNPPQPDIYIEYQNVDLDCLLGGAGFRDCLFQAIIVGEPAPTGILYIEINRLKH